MIKENTEISKRKH